MKQKLALITVLSLLLCLAACGSQTAKTETAETEDTSATQTDPAAQTTQDPDLAQLREQMNESGDLCAIACLGYFDMGEEYLEEYLTQSGVYEDFPFAKDIPQERYITTEGIELYLVVPRDPDAGVTVKEWICSEANNYAGEPGETLYQSDTGDPILIQGNYDDEFPNMQLVITSGKDSLTYTPEVSFGGFSMMLAGISDLPVLDCTSIDDHYSLDPAELEGDWAGTVFGTKETGTDCTFTIAADGTIQLCYGPEGEIYDSYYEGTWSHVDARQYDQEDQRYPDGMIGITLQRTKGSGPETLSGTYYFAWSQNMDEELLLMQVDGDFLPPVEGAAVVPLVMAVG